MWFKYIVSIYFWININQFGLKAKWKLNNNYSNGNIKYNTNLLNN